jgi:hypothetical protein
MHPNHWQNNQLQYARLIAELEQAGAFTSEIVGTLCIEMDLEPQNIFEIVERACQELDEHKAQQAAAARNPNIQTPWTTTN